MFKETRKYSLHYANKRESVVEDSYVSATRRHTMFLSLPYCVACTLLF